jgi:hypothetical protein
LKYLLVQMLHSTLNEKRSLSVSHSQTSGVTKASSGHDPATIAFSCLGDTRTVASISAVSPRLQPEKTPFSLFKCIRVFALLSVSANCCIPRQQVLYQ